MRPLPVLTLGLVLSLGLAACGGEGPAKDPSTPAAGGARAATTTTAAAAAVPAKATSLRRSEVRAAIAKGVGALLQNVSVEDVPEFRDKKFYGFKLRGLTGRWAGAVDLQPGDVIRKVNGIVIERPEHAVAALKALETAPSLEIEYERAGKPGVIELPIVGD